MTAILPTRISLYDFLIEDSAPIDAILADSGKISLSQAYLLRCHGLQAIVSALLAYEQKHGADNVLKKLFNRASVKELRKYNAFNLNTMYRAKQYDTTAQVLFGNEKTLNAVCDILADVAHTSRYKTRIVLDALSLIALRELAILADFARLDSDDLSQWFEYQDQFLQLDRSQFITPHYVNAHRDTDVQVEAPFVTKPSPSTLSMTEPLLYPVVSDIYVVVNYDTDWHKITGYSPTLLDVSITQNAPNNSTPNYAKAIGRLSPPSNTTSVTSSTTLKQTTDAGKDTGNSDNIEIKHASNVADGSTTSSTHTTSLPKKDGATSITAKPIVEKEKQNDTLVFASLPNISLPHSRWLLQLAKVADIYISRNRLKIAPEPVAPPPRPLLSFSLANEPKDDISAISNDSATKDTSIPFWKDKTIYMVVAVIGVLGFLSVLKYQYQAATSDNLNTVLHNNTQDSDQARQPSYDIAVMRVRDDEADDTNNGSSDTLTEADATATLESSEEDTLSDADNDTDIIATVDDDTGSEGINTPQDTSTTAISEVTTGNDSSSNTTTNNSNAQTVTTTTTRSNASLSVSTTRTMSTSSEPQSNVTPSDNSTASAQTSNESPVVTDTETATNNEVTTADDVTDSTTDTTALDDPINEPADTTQTSQDDRAGQSEAGVQNDASDDTDVDNTKGSGTITEPSSENKEDNQVSK